MDFTRTFETTTKCNNINHAWRHFYKILVVLKYHRRLWANIFDTDISRWINTYIKVVYFTFGIVMLLQRSVSKILSHRRLWYFKTTNILQKWFQTWFILLHLVLIWNVRVKSIWTHSAPLFLLFRQPCRNWSKAYLGLKLPTQHHLHLWPWW